MTTGRINQVAIVHRKRLIRVQVVRYRTLAAPRPGGVASHSAKSECFYTHKMSCGVASYLNSEVKHVFRL